jgi:hypothetical protein
MTLKSTCTKLGGLAAHAENRGNTLVYSVLAFSYRYGAHHIPFCGDNIGMLTH